MEPNQKAFKGGIARAISCLLVANWACDTESIWGEDKLDGRVAGRKCPPIGGREEGVYDLLEKERDVAEEVFAGGYMETVVSVDCVLESTKLNPSADDSLYCGESIEKAEN